MSNSIRICGVAIPRGKHAFIALMSIYGIGKSSSLKMLKDLGIESSADVYALGRDAVSSIAKYVEENFVVEGELRKRVALSIDKLKSIGCYRGIRHRRGLPVRGQRTHSNARTRKGKAVPIAGKKK